MSHKKDKRLIQSEKSILGAGIKVLLENSSAGMSEIAAVAGIGRATMYRHFETREVLIKQIAKTCLVEIGVALKPTEALQGRAAIEAIFDVLMPFADRYSFLVNMWALVEQDEELTQIDTQQINELGVLINQAKENGEINDQLPTVWITTFFDNTLNTAWKLVQAGEISSKNASQYAKQSFFSGCAK